jgi:shikimate dehydrogenase
MKLVGLIGYPLGHSISPAFQQPALDALGIDARYDLWETPAERLPEVVAGLRGGQYLGANVTIPHKQAVLPFLDEVDSTARAIGAVNTIVRDGSRLLGFNTDVVGFARAVEDDGGIPLRGSRVTVMGAGGAARAAVAAALLAGAARVIVRARRTEQAAALVADFAKAGLGEAQVGDPLSPCPSPTRGEGGPAPLPPGGGGAGGEGTAILVNATPLGTAHRTDSATLPIDPDLLHPGLLVCDLVYNPPETPLLLEARRRGAKTLNGLPMLVYQGAAALERWTERPAPVGLMRRKAEEALRG